MIYRISILLLATLSLTIGCKKKQPSTQEKPDEVEFRVPDSLEEIGTTIADHIAIWVFTLSYIETEEDAATASKRLDIIADQFELLSDRAKELPKISDEQFKLIDRQIDHAISDVSGGLERERRRIFLLPDSVKSKILPAHENLVKKFRATSRAIQANSRK